MDKPQTDPWTIYTRWIDPKRLKLPSAFPPLPDSMLSDIGYVAIGWSIFERDFDLYLEWLIAANETNDIVWRGLRGNKRRSRFRREFSKQFGNQPLLVSGAEQLLTDAKRLGDIRHTLLHGQVSLIMGTRGGVRQSLIKAVGNGETIELGKEGLSDLFYDFCHLSGRMSDYLRPTLKPDASPDKQRLASFAGQDHPTLPILSKPKGQPPASPE